MILMDKNYVGILLERKGKLLFQLRDNNDKISNPNTWGLFGGGIEKGETPKQAIIREIKEELDITLDQKRIIPLLKTKKISIFYYALENHQNKFSLHEGQAYHFFKIHEIIFKKNILFSLRLLLLVYPLLKIFKKSKRIKKS